VRSYCITWEPRRLKQHILRARVEAAVLGQAAVPQQELLDPRRMDTTGTAMTDSSKPTTTDVPAASQAIVEMVRCQVSVSIQSKCYY